MADEPLTNKEAQPLIDKLLTQLRKSEAKTTKGQETASKKFESAVDAIEGLSDEQKKRANTAAVLEQTGYSKQSAMILAKSSEQLDMVKDRLSSLNDTLESTGQDVSTNPEIMRLEAEKKSIEEFQKFGRNLDGFERTFIKFAGGTFEEMKKSVQEGGNLTAAGIGQSLGQNLRGDFDKILSFFGPAVGLLQQIPFLGTILTFIGQSLKSVLIRLALAAKDRIFNKKTDQKQLKIDETNLKINQRNAKIQEQQLRTQNKAAISGQTITGGGDDQPVEEGGGDAGPNRFTSAALFLGTAAAIGGVAGAGLAAAGKGMLFFGKASIGIAKALVVGGGALALGLTAVFGAFALGEKMGAFEGMEAFGQINMLKVLGSMLGLATLMGTLGMIVTSGIGALIMGAGALAIMALVGTLVVMGVGLGKFAESILPFENMNVPRIKGNISEIASVSGDIKKLMDAGSGGFSIGNFFDHPLSKLAQALKPYEKDMGNTVSNLTELKGALTGFELPQTTLGEAIADFFGVGGVDQLENLASIDFTPGIGGEMELIGKGVTSISKALGGLDDKKIDNLKGLTKALKGMDKVELNFGITAPATPQLQGMSNQSAGQTTNNVVSSQPIQQVNNTVRQSFQARGSNMMNHSALHGYLG